MNTLRKPRINKQLQDKLTDLYIDGYTINQIANKLNVSFATVVSELEYIGVRAIPTKSDKLLDFNHALSQDTFYMWLGIMWGLSRINNERIIISYSNKQILESLCEYMNPTSNVHQKDKSKPEQWHFDIVKGHPLYSYFLEAGFMRRADKDRHIPNNLNDYQTVEFIRGYLYIHSCIDKRIANGKKVRRLRVYAAKNILESVNECLVNNLGVKTKRVQNHISSEVCCILYYQGQREILVIEEFVREVDKRIQKR